MTGISDKACSTNKLIPNIKDRCRQSGRSFVLDGIEFHKFEFFLIAVFKKLLNAIMQDLYVDAQMSVHDLCGAFRNQLGLCPSDRTVYNLVKNSGIPMRTRAECKSLSWQQGKMAGSMAKSRQSRKKTYLLREALLVLDVKWDVIIGDNLQHILDRFEVDIPLVIVDRQTSKACRIAVEIDNTFTHSGQIRQKLDARKDAALKKAGWHVIRINGEQFRKNSVLAEAVSDLSLQVEQLAEETFINQNFLGG